MKMFKSSYFPYVRVEVVKKVLYMSLSAFDHFAGHLQGIAFYYFLL